MICALYNKNTLAYHDQILLKMMQCATTIWKGTKLKKGYKYIFQDTQLSYFNLSTMFTRLFITQLYIFTDKVHD